MSENSLLTFLEGNVTAEEHTISLKSCVPVFIALPQLIHSTGGSIAKIAKYYDKDIDYNKEGNILLKDGLTNKELLYYTSKLLETVISGVISKTSQLEYLPKLFLKVDIATRELEFRTIGPDAETIADYENRINSTFSLRTFFSALDVSPDNINHKHNILLVDELIRITNDNGVGGL